MNQAWMQGILERYGQSVTVLTAEGETADRAFLQPVAERGEHVPTGMTGLGWDDARDWLYLGLSKVEEGDTVSWKEYSFRVRSSRAYYIGEELNHWWALLEQAKEAAE